MTDKKLTLDTRIEPKYETPRPQLVMRITPEYWRLLEKRRIKERRRSLADTGRAIIEEALDRERE